MGAPQEIGGPEGGLAAALERLTALAASLHTTPEATAVVPAAATAADINALVDVVRTIRWFEGAYDGEPLNPTQVLQELSDFHFLLGEVPKVYQHVTGGLLSKANYHAEGVIIAHDDYVSRLVADELKDTFGPGALAIAKERQRQTDEEGWSEEHDDQYTEGELARAGASYALRGAAWAYPPNGLVVASMEAWPWRPEWWKPHSPMRDLERAGALVAAEIDRLHRAGEKAND